MQEVTNLKQVSLEDVKDVGEKAGYLGTLSKGFNVAPGYILTKKVFEGFIEDNQFRSKIRNLLAIADVKDEDRLQDVANEIQKLILSGKLNNEVQENIIEAYYSLNIKDDAPLQELVDTDKEPIVVVRASPTYQSPEKVHVSILHVKGREKLIKSVIACYASLFTAEAIRSRAVGGQKDVGMGVIIQNMILPHVSGNVHQEKEDIIVNACYGLSDETSEFDRYVVSDALEMKTASVVKQKEAYMQDPDSLKLSKVSLSEIKSSNQKLNDKQVLTLARLFKKSGLKDKKIEYIIDKENYYFIQVLNMDEKPTGIKDTQKEAETDETADEPERVVVDLEEKEDLKESPKPESEDMNTKEKEDGQSKENTLFALFKSNRGDELPDIPTTPVDEREKPAEKRPEDQDKPKTVEEEPEELVTTVDEPMEEEKVEVYDEPEEDEEPDIEEEPMDEPEDEASRVPDEVKFEKVTPKPERMAKSEIHPLNREEWFDTLRMEHTKIIISYDLVILNALKSKYSQLFNDEPPSFEEMIDKLDSEEKVPYISEIKKIRRLRNEFLQNHKAISIEELKESYEATVLFLREFL